MQDNLIPLVFGEKWSITKIWNEKQIEHKISCISPGWNEKPPSFLMLGIIHKKNIPTKAITTPSQMRGLVFLFKKIPNIGTIIM